MNQVRKRNLLTIEVIKYNSLCLEINNLWYNLYSIFNLAQDCHVNIDILKEFPDKALKEWPLFLREEFMKAITKCNNSFALEPDKLLQSHLKYIINNKVCLGKIISIANACFELGLQPTHFKSSITIIIPKPNKESYSSHKSF